MRLPTERKFIALIILICIVVGLVATSVLTDKQDIRQADYYDIIEVYGVGDILAERILDYIENNPDFDIDDLIYVEGIGEKKLESIKEVFR